MSITTQTAEQSREASPSAVNGVQQVVFVVRRNDELVAILEMTPNRSFRMTSRDGRDLGIYLSVGQAHAALDAWITDSPLPSAATSHSQ